MAGALSLIYNAGFGDLRLNANSDSAGAAEVRVSKDYLSLLDLKEVSNEVSKEVQTCIASELAARYLAIGDVCEFQSPLINSMCSALG